MSSPYTPVNGVDYNVVDAQPKPITTNYGYKSFPDISSNPIFNSIVYIETIFSSNQTGKTIPMRGSGALVGPNDILTAAHVVHIDGYTLQSIRIYPGYDNGSYGKSQIFTSGSWIEQHFNIQQNVSTNAKGELQTTMPPLSSASDLALIGVSVELGRYQGYLPIAPVSGVGWTGTATILGYPADQGREFTASTGSISIKSTNSTQSNDFWETINPFGHKYESARPPVIDISKLYISGGSSGGPIIDASGNVIGVVSTAKSGAAIDQEFEQIKQWMVENNKLLQPQYQKPEQKLAPTSDSIAIDATNNFNQKIIRGTSADELINGSDGDDVIVGGLGNDTMVGGLGNDIYEVQQSGDLVIENVNSGVDTVYSSISYTLPENVEALYLTANSRYGIGNKSDNYIDAATYSGPADNVLWGLDGDDTLVGGGGNDTLIGGIGIDTAAYSGSMSKVRIFTQVNEFGQLSFILNDLNVVSEGIDRLVSIEKLSFSDGTIDLIPAPEWKLFGTISHSIDEVGGKLYALYSGLLGRPADIQGLEYWADALQHGADLRTIAQQFLLSPEGQARAGALDNTGFITQLYQTTLSRNPDPRGLASWVSALDNGMDRASAALGFVYSAEHLNVIRESIDAGIFVPDQQASDIARLYYTLLDRAPDSGGLENWTAMVDNGATLKSIAAGFLSATESRIKYGSLSNTDFVKIMYTNALDRAPETAGLNGWTDQLNRGLSREDFAVLLATSPEAHQVHLAEIEQGWNLV